MPSPLPQNSGNNKATGYWSYKPQDYKLLAQARNLKTTTNSKTTNYKEYLHGVQVEERRLALGKLDGRDADRPHVTLDAVAAPALHARHLKSEMVRVWD